MDINTVKLIYFSPTGTTRKVLEGIAEGVHPEKIDHLDLTLPEAETTVFEPVSAVLVIFGIPVYAGRVPEAAVNRIRRLQVRGIPAVIIAVYGNRAYEDALVELRDLAEAAGFVPVAAGAFIGEHSFSRKDVPIAAGRPDDRDLEEASAFGRRIRQKLEGAKGLLNFAPLAVPGNRPYKDSHLLPIEPPGTLENRCTLCGICAEVCPVGAVTLEGDVVGTGSGCIHCCACVKRCPAGARVMTSPRVKTLVEHLTVLCAGYKSPEVFL